MSTEQLLADDSEHLAAMRPWRRRMWERVPGWVRIGLTAVLVLAVIHIALGVRIWYGLQDPAEVARFRGLGRRIMYRDEEKMPSIWNWYSTGMAGLRGRTTRDVARVAPFEQTTDDDLRCIARHFPNVKVVAVWGGTITTTGLLALKDCPEVWMLNASDTQVDDGIAALLPNLPKLNHLTLDDTNVGDAFAMEAAKCSHLLSCSIKGTRVSPEAVAAWRIAQPKCAIDTDFDTVALRGSLRWSDGIQTHMYRGPVSIELRGPRDALSKSGWKMQYTVDKPHLISDRLQWSPKEIESNGDGVFQVVVSVGLRKPASKPGDPLEFIPSEPAEFVVTDGKPTPARLEFQFPITRAESFERNPNKHLFEQ